MPRLAQALPIEARIERHLARDGGEDGCWVWTANRNQFGYGRMAVGSRTDGTKRLAVVHRLAYELWVGPVPTGMVLDHLCRNPPCCNPAHLEPVTERENIRRGIGQTSRNAGKTHCPQGHPYDAENTRVEHTPWGKARRCATCKNGRARARYAHSATSSLRTSNSGSSGSS